MSIKNTPNAERPLIYKYAEEWLDKAVDGLREHFKKYGHKVPEVLVSVGFSHHGYNPKINYSNYDGYCYSRHMSKANINEIYISPFFTEPIEIIFLLAHELIHSIDDCHSGHGARFKSIAKDLGMRESGELHHGKYFSAIKAFEAIAEPLGRYPRNGVNYKNSLTVPNHNYKENRLNELEWKRSINNPKINAIRLN